MKTVVIELHGFNGSYIDNKITPFLCNLADRFGANSIEPPFGPDALTTLWTGVYPKRHDEFFKFAYHGNKFNLQSIFPYTLCNLIFNGDRLFKGYDFLTRLAPEKKTGLFSVHKKYHYCHPGGLNVETLFDILRENEKTFLFYEHPCLATDKSSKLLIAPGRDKDREKSFVSEIKQNEKDFYFILLREADILGHQFGPGSREVNQVLKIQDHIVENIIAHFSLKDILIKKFQKII